MTAEIEQDSNGLYTVCVMSSNMPSDSQVHDDFEQFGPIVRLNRYKESVVFVRYRSKEEATQCYKKMQNHPIYRVNPGRSNKDQNSNMNRGGGGFNDRGEGDSRRFDNRRRFEENGVTNSGDSSNKSTFGSSGNLNHSSMPKLIPMTMVPRVEEGAQAFEQPKKLIIGNLPPRMKQGNLYNLCKTCKAIPLHITMENASHPSYPPVHYAIVYVKNDKEVEDIVSGLHHLTYNDYKLLAQPLETMVEIGKQLSSDL